MDSPDDQRGQNYTNIVQAHILGYEEAYWTIRRVIRRDQGKKELQIIDMGTVAAVPQFLGLAEHHKGLNHLHPPEAQTKL
ncbi:GL18153 [Drosophila persimilis]|uniref:GL18153 n=1 Tax=Drosophila persimilis TaxID=7234 RepID=B4H856_DROPE|nr:GL18153 [Drosophila persimilis]